MKLSRRGFLRVAAITGSAAAGTTAAGRARAAGLDKAGENETAMLVDTTVCAGCRACEAACSEANGLTPPKQDVDLLKERRDTGPEAFTVVNGTQTDGGEPRYAKRQCMHCLEPACASACPVRALDKSPDGPVTYDGNRCMGCRYCMVACPFEIPKYQYDRAAPLVRKCQFCAQRQAEGKRPACAEACPTGALTFGKRGALLELAKHRIYRTPDKYVHHVYGEHEAGGTNWMYITDVPFEKLAMRSVRDEPYPDKVQGALGAPPFVMTLWPPLLMGLYAFSKRRDAADGNGHGDAAAKPEEKGDHHG